MRIYLLWACLCALSVMTFTASGLAGSGAAPVAIDDEDFLPNQVIHLPGSDEIVIYGASERSGTVGSADLARLTNSDGGESASWSFQYLSSACQTATQEMAPYFCLPGSVCEGKLYYHSPGTFSLLSCNIAGDGLTTSGCAEIPNFEPDNGGLTVLPDGDLLFMNGNDPTFRLFRLFRVNPTTGASVLVPGCSEAGTGTGIGGGIANGFIFLYSDSPSLGNMDIMRMNWNGTSCSGSRVNFNDIAGYADINTTARDWPGAIDPLTGDYYFLQPNDPWLPMLAKLTPACGDGFISGRVADGNKEQCDPAAAVPLNGAVTCEDAFGAGWTGTLGCNASTCQYEGCSEVTTPACPDGTCNSTETCSSCPQDCGQCCGNGDDSDPGEQCDLGTAQNGNVCTAAYDSTCNWCSATCQNETEQGPHCGDGSINGPEQCDGTQLDGATCASEGAGTGDLTCNPTTCLYDTSGCTLPEVCDNGTCGPGESFENCPQDCDPPFCPLTLSPTSTCDLDCSDADKPIVTGHGGVCEISYLPAWATNPTPIQFTGLKEGYSLLFNIPVTPGELRTELSVSGFESLRVRDGDAEFGFKMASCALGVEGTDYLVELVSGSVYRVSVLEGKVKLTLVSSGDPLDFTLSDGQGEISAGESVEIDFNTGEPQGTGGEGGAGGAANTGGNATGGNTTGGAANTGGNATGGNTDSGGTGAVSAGAGGGTSGATTSTGGSTAGGSSGDSGGCSCATVGSGRNFTIAFAALLALMMLLLRASRISTARLES